MELAEAASRLQQAEVLLITAGAGLGVDGGLGTFRGSAAASWAGLRAYGLRFQDMSSPDRFLNDDRYGGPRTAWGFWKWRADAYSRAPLHDGYRILQRWADEKGPDSTFVFTSNIDGHFRRLGGFEDRLVECHGTLDFLQCQTADSPNLCPQGDRLWPTPYETIAALEVNPHTHQVVSDLPLCPGCGRPARPAVLMFGDGNCSHALIGTQHQRLDRFFDRLQARAQRPSVAVVELGAGVAIPTVRRRSEVWAEEWGALLVRMNPEFSEVNSDLPAALGMRLGAREALVALDQAMGQSGASDS